jgi:hypothetical protein
MSYSLTAWKNDILTSKKEIPHIAICDNWRESMAATHSQQNYVANQINQNSPSQTYWIAKEYLFRRLRAL